MNSQILLEHGFGLGDELLVADLQVALRSERGTGSHSPLDPQPPMQRQMGCALGPEVGVHEREGHVTAVTNEVDEPSLGERTGEQREAHDVRRRLVAVARLARGGCPQLEDRPHRVRDVARSIGPEVCAHLGFREPPLLEEFVPGQEVDHPIRVGATAAVEGSGVFQERGMKRDSGGITSSGCESSIARNSVVPDRPHPTTMGKQV